jgi:hypothetical protein
MRSIVFAANHAAARHLPCSTVLLLSLPAVAQQSASGRLVVWGRAVACALMICGVSFGAVPAVAEDIDSEHLFGFTQGTDIGAKGDREVELEGFGGFGKGQGAYSALAGGLEGKFTIFDNFRVAPGIGIAHHNVSGVPGLDDRTGANFEGFSLEMKFRLLERHLTGIGLTVGVTPGWARVDDASGEPVDSKGLGLLLATDYELVRGWLLSAFNMTYDLAATRSHITGQWSHDSLFGLSGAIAAQVVQNVFLGVEARYARAYGGLALDHFDGHALFVGPTAYARFPNGAWISAAWNAQVAGRSVEVPGALDLTNFPHHEVVVRFGQPF